MKHYLRYVISGITTAIITAVIINGVSANNKKDTRPIVSIGVTTSGSGIINVISNPKIGDIDSYTRLAIAAKENNRDGYTKIARVISEAFDDNLKERMSSVFCSYGISAKSVMVIINSTGKLDAISIPFKPLNGVMPTEAQVYLIFTKLQNIISFESWEGEPQYLSLMIGRIPQTCK